MKINRIILAGFLFSAVLNSQIFAQVTVGQAAPDFSLPDTQGKSHNLSDYKGKYVVLEWANHDCPFVRKHYDGGNMQALQKAYTSKGVVWLTVASSAPGKQGHYSAEDWNFLTQKKGASPSAVLLDPKGDAGRLYDAKTTPHMYIINPEGKLIYQGAIDSISSADSADVAKADNYVRMALDEAMNGKPVTNSNTKSYGCSVKY